MPFPSHKIYVAGWIVSSREVYCKKKIKNTKKELQRSKCRAIITCLTCVDNSTYFMTYSCTLKFDYFCTRSMKQKNTMTKRGLPWEMNPFLGILTLAVNGIFAGSIFYNLNPLICIRLLVTVPGDHIQLTNMVLYKKKGKWTRDRD